MFFINSVHLSGYLGCDPELKKMESGDKKISICTFTIGVHRIYAKKGEQNSDFFKITTFNKQAEFAAKYLQKGRKIIVEGTLKQDRYQGEDGKTRYAVSINANKIEFCDTKHEENEIADTAAYVSSFTDFSGLEGADFQTESFQ